MKIILSVIGAGVLLALPVGAQGLSLNFSSSPGASIQFNGSSSSFQFDSSTSSTFGGFFLGTQWFIGTETGGSAAVGLFGSVGSSVFTYGPITTTGTEQSAMVTGPAGQLVINDGSGYNLTGIVNWGQIETFNYAGALNASLGVNVTDLSYSGSNADLKALIADGAASMNLTFQFAPGETLSQLTSGSSPFLTSYSGSISATAVPEPTTVSCSLIGLTILGFVQRLKTRQSKI